MSLPFFAHPYGNVRRNAQWLCKPQVTIISRWQQQQQWTKDRADGTGIVYAGAGACIIEWRIIDRRPIIASSNWLRVWMLLECYCIVQLVYLVFVARGESFVWFHRWTNAWRNVGSIHLSQHVWTKRRMGWSPECFLTAVAVFKINASCVSVCGSLLLLLGSSFPM